MCVIVFRCLINVFVCFVCGVLCDVVWYVVECVVDLCVRVPLFSNVCACVGGAILCEVVWLVCCCVLRARFVYSCVLCLTYCVMFYGSRCFVVLRLTVYV